MYYDYFEKDHLGNVRVVLTDELKTDAYPAATMETANEAIETLYYNNWISVDPPKEYPADTPPGNRKVTVVKGNTGFGPSHLEIGPGILLKVMSGDKFNLNATSWWSDQAAPVTPYSSYGFGQLLSAIGGSTIVNTGHFGSGEVQSSTELYNSVTDFLNNQSYNSSKPKAFVNWIAFDEQFKYVSSTSGYEQVGGTDTLTPHTRTDLPVDKNGYLYVYVSNETPNIDVYFDNLQVTHIRGPLLSEDHYYPFGLTMAGISSKALSFGDPKNKEKTFQGQRFDDELGLNWIQFKWRNHDPQIGRFIEIDPLSEKYEYNSTYAFSENRVINAIELEGLEAVLITNTYDKDGKLTNTSIINNKPENYGPLGNGTYTVNKSADGTFTESFQPGEGNSVNPFYADGLSQSRWIEGDRQGGYETRLQGRVIEKMTEDGLVAMGFDEKQVQKDVVVLETDDKSFKGKFAAFASADVVGKYTSGWESSTPSSPHKSNSAYESGEVFGSDVGIKVYDGAKSNTDIVGTHIGLVRSSPGAHFSEAVDAKLFGNGVNIGVRNAWRVKRYQEKK
ncbi:MAG: hypothetical protein IPO53_11835 [Chitinophagaceae bacterium]|nr:hypothetical protein [Chitinophagaceae bacterium]